MTVDLIAVIVGVAALLGWYLSYSAARLDRLHARVEGALSALDAQLVRRAEATLELANSGELDAASSLILASAASEAAERQTEHGTDDLLDGLHFGGREPVESDLSEALAIALTPEVIDLVRAHDGMAAAALARVEAASTRVQLARRFHNNAVKDVQRVRGKWIVRLFRLAGHAAMPATVEFDDAVPTIGRT